MVIKLFKYSLKGSTIIEPVVSTVILVVVIGMSLGILTRYNTTTPVKAINKANEMIQEELYYTIQENKFLNSEIENGAFTLFKTVDYNIKSGKIILVLEVFDIKKKSIAKREVLLSDRNYSVSDLEETKSQN